jgi:hypothetical protein
VLAVVVDPLADPPSEVVPPEVLSEEGLLELAVDVEPELSVFVEPEVPVEVDPDVPVDVLVDVESELPVVESELDVAYGPVDLVGSVGGGV